MSSTASSYFGPNRFYSFEPTEEFHNVNVRSKFESYLANNCAVGYDGNILNPTDFPLLFWRHT